MPIWKSPPACGLPTIRLSQWRIFETDSRSRHFVGVDPRDLSGRVSSMIVTFDPDTLRGTTETGRIYELLGRKGWSLNAEYVWKWWCDRYGVASYTDVTDSALRGSDDEDTR